MTVEKIEKKKRADRRLGRLTDFLESRLTSTSEAVVKQAVDRLCELALAQLQLKSEREKRQHEVRTRPAGDPAKAQVLRELQAKADARVTSAHA